MPKKVPGVREDPPGSGRWIVDAWINGKRIRQVCGSYRNAVDFIAKAREDGRRRKLFPEEYVTSITVREALERYFEVNRPRNDVSDKYHRILLAQVFGDVHIEDLTAHDIQKWMRRRLKEPATHKGRALDRTVSPATVNRQLGLLKRVCRKALRDGKTRWDPTLHVQLFEEPPGRTRILSHKEIDSLRRTLGHHWNIVELAILTGLRQANLFELRRDQVDLDHGRIDLGRTKSGHPHHVYLIPRSRSILKRILSSHESDWVFPNVSGSNHVNAKTWTARVWRPTLHKLGIENLRFHDCRHTFASMLAMKGASQSELQALLGHRTSDMTNRYTHLTAEHLKRAMRRLDGVTEQHVINPQPKGKLPRRKS